MHDLLTIDTATLVARAGALRDAVHGRRVTYSPKVFIPLTHLCRDKCGYCTFAQPPARLDDPYMSPEQVLAVASQGADAGCHEALFTLGERPELRYPAAAAWLAEHGYVSTIDYLVAMAALVRAETGLLPHANAGALYADELAALRTVSPSQGMMIETLRADLDCHRGSPDKEPARRLATLEAAGELAIPFTTGILVGLGESRADRLEALEAIAASHRRHGHVQEVIVQNFLPKPGTGMHLSPACPPEELVWSVAVARLVLPADVVVQVPPNLSDDLGPLLAAGVSDWGGVSPVTADFVNPERPWPSLERLQAATEAHGFTLAPRLTVHPRYVLEPQRWIDPGLLFAVMDRSDAEGLGRDDPGAVWPERIEAVAKPSAGADVHIVGPVSTAWYSGSEAHPTTLVPAASTSARVSAVSSGAVREVLDGVLAGQEVGVDEIVTLFSARGAEVAAVAEVADDLRRRVVGDDVTWVHNRNINYTNVCTFKCRFCGFSKGPLSLNLRGTPYVLTLEDIQGRVLEAVERGATEVCLQGGIHPDFDGDYYVHVAQAVKDVAPGIHIHGFTALEVHEGARRLGEPLADYLCRLMAAGLRSLPGTAAEILDDEVRATLCPDKVNTEEWLEVHRQAHAVGLRSNVTIMFGSIERPVHWARHMVRTRALQRETGGFTEFVPLPFVHMAAPIYLQRKARRGPTFREALLMHAVGRIAYHGAIDNIQASWVKLGPEGARQCLQAGVNDLGGTLMDENISRAAGASHGQLMDLEGFHRMVDPLGRPLVQRTTLYQVPVTAKMCSMASPPVARPARAPSRSRARRPLASTGVEAIDTHIADLLAEAGATHDLDLLTEIVVAVVQMATEGTERADLKIASASLAEMRHAFRVFRPYRDAPKATMFGSARTRVEDPLYEQAKEMARVLAEEGWMVVTGAGPGIMEAGMQGAGRARSFGVTIKLPFESGANAVIAGDEKLVDMKYFFTRKLMLVKESRAFVALPGGFGTLDETFELLTLMQTGKAVPAPVVLLDVPGGSYWREFQRFVDAELMGRGLVSAHDHELYLITDDVAAARHEITHFWSNFDSLRYVGDRLVIRLHHAPTDEELVVLNERFGWLCRRGGITASGPLAAEVTDDDRVDLPRIVLRLEFRQVGRLRALVNALNDLGSASAGRQEAATGG